MTMKCVNGIDVHRLRATRDLIEADADGIGHFVPLSGYLREIRLGAGRIARKLRKQLVVRTVPGQSGSHQSLQIAEE
jgi:hypothetical protein